MNHSTPPLRPHRNRPRRRQLAAIGLAIAVIASSCGSDESDDSPATTLGVDTQVTAPLDEGGAGVSLEPGSNLPPGDSESTPSDSTVGSELLEPADSLVGSGDD